MPTRAHLVLALPLVFAVAACDGSEPGDSSCTDADRDGTCAADDCDDGDAALHPDATEESGNLVDEDCDGFANDVDGDGVEAIAHGGTDCDDADASRSPNAPEVGGNTVDEDCSGVATD